MTALVSLSAGGAITGFSFVPKAAADISSPTSMPLNLAALQQSARPGHSARTAPGSDAMLRKAIVSVADYYLRMAESKTPAEMEAIIWRHDSIDGADHGQSCAAFASLTLELAAQVVGQQSWVSGGSSYPWPLHSWADVRVDANPDSLGIISIQQDAQAQHRWRPLGDGYRPLPGDWVLFDGHVEVVTEDSGGVLRTVGGDSLPNFSVNAHEYRAPLSSAGVVGFVNNGSLPAATGGARQDASSSGGQGVSSGSTASATDADAASAGALAAIPGTQSAAPQQAGAPAARSRESGTGRAGSRAAARRESGSRQAGRRDGARPMSAHTAPGDAAIPGLAVPAPRSGGATDKPATGHAPGGKAAEQASARPAAAAARGDAAIPGLDVGVELTGGHHDVSYRRHHPSPARKPVSETRAQQAFISQVAPGAIAAQHRYGVPAAVTIAQAIDESGWGQSELAAQDHNLFGIKGTGPAGSVPMPTQEYVNGQPVSTSASFRVYHDAAESIDDHGRLLARSGYYQQAMAEHRHPDKFAAALTGVYATDPNYGASLISLMRRYDLYRYSASDAHRPDRGPAVAQPGGATIPGVSGPVTPPAQPSGSATAPPATPKPTRTITPEPTRTATPSPTQTGIPEPTRTASPGPSPTQTGIPAPTPTASPTPSRTASPTPTRPANPNPSLPGVPEPTGTAIPAPARTPVPPPTAAGSPQPSGTRPSQRTATGSAKSAGTTTAQPPASARPAATRSPQPAPAKNRRATRAAPSSPAGSRPSSAPSAPSAPSAARADIPASARPMTSAVSFGPAARFVPVKRSAPARPRSAPSARRTGTARPAASPVRATLTSARRYQPHMPRSVLNSFVQTAKGPLLSEETLYRDVASFRGISWQLLAACDWMQCDARPRRSPVYGERLGSLNADGTVYTSKSAALARCADDLIRLADTVYGIDLTGRRDLSVRDLANAFAAFRWGALLKAHDCSALEFPYSVAGLTDHHLGMRWPRIAAPGTGDRPGSRYRRPFGAVPIVLGLDYQATV
jgi:flagellum-specific peptidoglycan hydrolase FlgJ